MDFRDSELVIAPLLFNIFVSSIFKSMKALLSNFVVILTNLTFSNAGSSTFLVNSSFCLANSCFLLGSYSILNLLFFVFINLI